MRPSELGLVLSVDSQLFSEGYACHDHPRTLWWVVTDGLEIVAYAGAEEWKIDDEHALNLTRAGVLDAYRGRGLQRRLIRARIRYARKIGCQEVWTYTHWRNYPSANNLLRCGFSMWAPAFWGGCEVDFEPTSWLYWRRGL